MSSDSESECSYNYSPERKLNISEDEDESYKEGNNEGTPGPRRRFTEYVGKRRGSFESITSVKRFRRGSSEYSNSGSDHREGNEGEEEEEQKENRGDNCRSSQEDESRCGSGDEEGEYNEGGSNSYFSVISNFDSMDKGFSSTYNYDFRDFDLSLLEGERIRGQEVFTHIDGLPPRSTEDLNSAKERVRKVFIENFSDTPLKQRVVHNVFGAGDDFGNINVDHEQLRRKFFGAILLIAHHGNHIHVVHDRTYSNNSCRCAFTQYLPKQIYRRYSRRVFPSWKFTIQH